MAAPDFCRDGAGLSLSPPGSPATPKNPTLRPPFRPFHPLIPYMSPSEEPSLLHTQALPLSHPHVCLSVCLSVSVMTGEACRGFRPLQRFSNSSAQGTY